MEVREGYKNTEVGVIPEDWEVKSISEIVDVDTDNLTTSTNPDYVFKYISLEDVDFGILRNYSEQIFKFAPSRARRKVKKGDILISTVRPNLKSHLLITEEVQDWICSTGFSVLRSRNETDNVFLYNHFFASIINRQIENLITGSNYPAINSKEVKSLQIPLPPNKTEQTAIATALSDTDALINSLEKLIAKKRNIKQGAMQKLLQPKEGWEVKKLGEVCDFSSGTAHENFIDEKGDYVVVNSKFISTNGDVRKFANTLFCPAKEDDVLIVLSDVPNGKAIAKCFLVEKENFFTVNQRIGIIRPFQNISSKFLCFLINRHPYLLAFDDGAKQTNLRNQDVTGLPLCIPSTKEEQTRIATILFDMEAEIKALETKLEKYKKVKMGMMQNLLTGKIRLV